MNAPSESFLSRAPIPVHERLIVALDFDTAAEALALVDRLGDSVAFYKVGLQLFLAGNYLDLVDALRSRGKQVFADLKLFDVPETVASAVRQLTACGAQFATVHGNDAMLQAACAEKRDGLKLLAVTVLTSLDRGDLTDLGFSVEVEPLVLSRARRAVALGCEGVVASGLEARALRGALGSSFLIVSPGIRPVENRPIDDQKRIVSADQAFRNGADYVVVGRPIRAAADPAAAAAALQQSIAAVFAEAR